MRFADVASLFVRLRISAKALGRKETTSVSDDIHLNPETLEAYFSAGVPAAVTVSPALGVTLEIEPHAQTLRLVLPARGAEPDVTEFERLSVVRRSRPGFDEQFVVAVDASEVHYEAYAFLESILDGMRAGASLRKAVSDSLVGHVALLEKRSKLSAEQVAGLWGELELLGFLIEEMGASEALRAWMGPDAEEHDFAFDAYEVEVKTTTSESRRHVIGSATQLQPSPGRPLYLLSIQLTAGSQGNGATTLPQKVALLADRCGSNAFALMRRLETLGFHADDADLYPRRFQVRSFPRAYLVDDGFPAITQPRLQAAIPQPSLVSDVSYRVDVSSLPHVVPAGAIARFVEGPMLND